MNLQRIRELAGIKKPLTESVESVPGVGPKRLSEKSPKGGWNSAVEENSAPVNFTDYESFKNNPDMWDLKDIVAAFRANQITNAEYERLLDLAINGPTDDYDYTDDTMRRGEMGDYSRDLIPPGPLDEARFPNVGCSQCGQKFGPGNSGFSHCQDHAGLRPVDESAPPGMEDMVMKLKKEYPGQPEKAFATAWSIYNKKQGKTNEGDACSVDEAAYSDEVKQALADFEQAVVSYGMDPYNAYDRISQRMSPEGAEQLMAVLNQQGMDDAIAADQEPIDFPNPDYAPASDNFMQEDYDLNNGYNEVNYASGNDYFPTGADSPVVTDIAPNAKQGDNPEQKRVAVAEVHKDLVYRYRNFLNESKNGNLSR